MVGCLPIFQANQLTQVIIDLGINRTTLGTTPFNLLGFEVSSAKFIIGVVLTLLAGIVIIGGIQRIGMWAGRMVPIMIVIYLGSVIAILFTNITEVPHIFGMIFTDAFAANNYRGEPALGGDRWWPDYIRNKKSFFLERSRNRHRAHGDGSLQKQRAYSRRIGINAKPSY